MEDQSQQLSNTENEFVDPEQDTLEWYAFEYEHFDRSTDWFWIMGVVTICLFILSIYLGNFLFAMVIIMSGILLFFYSTRPPKEILIILSPEGVNVHGEFYKFEELKSFWVYEDHPLPKLVIETKKLFLPHIIIPAEEMDTEILKNYLKHHLPEVEHRISLISNVAEYLGF